MITSVKFWLGKCYECWEMTIAWYKYNTEHGCHVQKLIFTNKKLPSDKYFNDPKTHK